MTNINILSDANLRRTFSRFIRECDGDDKLSIKELWRQCNIKIAIVIRLPFQGAISRQGQIKGQASRAAARGVIL
jgi:hypothetical protein